jgi:hypothetical protein
MVGLLLDTVIVILCYLIYCVIGYIAWDLLASLPHYEKKDINSDGQQLHQYQQKAQQPLNNSTF